MEAYLDNSATTRVCESSARMVAEIMQTEYGNPSSMHGYGYRAEMLLTKARETFAGIWKCKKDEVLFTSGGTESDNLAILGSANAMARRGRHIVTTKVEHPAVYEAFMALEKQGYEVTILDVGSDGIISLEELSEAVRDDTILVSVMHVNNETGAVMPIEAAGKIIKKKNPSCLFHVDDVQGFTKLKLHPARAGVDLISASGHKIHAPKGVGALYVRSGVRLLPIIYGGGQQKGLRSGTENVPGIAAMAEAAGELFEKSDSERERLYGLRRAFITALDRENGFRVNGAGGFSYYDEGEPGGVRDRFAPHVISLSIPGVRSEVMLHSLEEKGIYVSAGSACSSHKRAPSRTLVAMGIEKELLDSTIRLSFSVFTTEEEVLYAAGVINELTPQLSMYTRR